MTEELRTKDSLLPCPFCGGSSRMATEHDPDSMTWHFVTCRQCGARSRGQWHSAGNDCPLLRMEVRDEWNRRTAHDDTARLDSNTILIKSRDEFGEPTSCIHTGLDLRVAIDAAIKESH